jgi:hypothetical protein
MRDLLGKTLATVIDGAMCSVMNASQWRHGHVCTAEDLQTYLNQSSEQTREDFYRIEGVPAVRENDEWLEWHSPVTSNFAENNRYRVRLQRCREGLTAPTVFILHALMSASDVGYRRLGRWFNERGWNAAFPHLPYHYSRRPAGYLTGELAITADLIRSAEGLRQGVMEIRQLMAWLRAQGGQEFGILGTSYGGWTGALLSFLESDFRFIGLIQPIVSVEAAIWENPTAAAMRRMLKARGIQRGESNRNAHLISPLHGLPLCGDDRVIITGGTYDTISLPRDLLALHKRWPNAKYREVRQGHFGYAALPVTMREIEPRL